MPWYVVSKNQCTNNAIRITMGSGMPISSNNIERMVFSFD